ncbi:ABC transporter ATP-binding protein, partial|nr:ABC transporter ATP-binding protein [Escherichia coli]
LDAPDRAAVERAARLAGAHDFIAALPQGYDARVGERGARPSGGQRQRPGIAPAPYHHPDVLVFDEATSALDEETQAAVMRALRALSGRRTLILIAHRLSTLEGADAVHVLEAGRLVASGPPEAVLPGLCTAA